MTIPVPATNTNKLDANKCKFSNDSNKNGKQFQKLLYDMIMNFMVDHKTRSKLIIKPFVH